MYFSTKKPYSFLFCLCFSLPFLQWFSPLTLNGWCAVKITIFFYSHHLWKCTWSISNAKIRFYVPKKKKKKSLNDSKKNKRQRTTHKEKQHFKHCLLSDLITLITYSSSGRSRSSSIKQRIKTKGNNTNITAPEEKLCVIKCKNITEKWWTKKVSEQCMVFMWETNAIK